MPTPQRCTPPALLAPQSFSKDNTVEFSGKLDNGVVRDEAPDLRVDAAFDACYWMV